MPELPEVEVARRAVQEHCAGHLIVRACVAEDNKVIEGVEPFELQRCLAGKRIVAAHRKGKQMWLELDEPPWPCFQFGMAGAVYIKGVEITKYIRSAVKDDEEWPSKYSKVFLEMDNGVEMSFTDKRRFARVRLLKSPTSVPPISELGPDALLELPTEEDFANSLKKKRISIKALLLDQSFLSGIGNWLADEVLYQAHIHPECPASSLSSEELKGLHGTIKKVIETSLEVGADSTKYPQDWIFHYREKKSGKPVVNGMKIEFITVGGRTSAYVPELQKYSGPPLGEQKKRSRVKKKKDEEEDTESIEETISQKKSKGGKKAASKKAGKLEESEDSEDNDAEEIGSSEEEYVDAGENTRSKASNKKPARAAKGGKSSKCSVTAGNQPNFDMLGWPQPVFGSQFAVNEFSTICRKKSFGISVLPYYNFKTGFSIFDTFNRRGGGTVVACINDDAFQRNPQMLQVFDKPSITCRGVKSGARFLSFLFKKSACFL